jgi:hypothetical protein
MKPLISVRLDSETAAELRWAARESGVKMSELVRRGLHPVLAYIRAEWHEKHGSEDDWEEVVAVRAGDPRRMDASFGVRLSYEQVLQAGEAARACGVTISAYLREAGLALASARETGGTASCQHMSAGRVASASCGTCGPLPVTYAVNGNGRH